MDCWGYKRLYKLFYTVTLTMGFDAGDGRMVIDGLLGIYNYSLPKLWGLMLEMGGSGLASGSINWK